MANYTRPDPTFPAIAESGVRTTLSPADVGAGWSTTSETRPPAADFNARDYLSSAGLKYLLRLGIAEYSPGESYQGLGLCAGSNGSVYWNLIACKGVDPVTDATGHWEKTAIRRADCAELIGNVTGGVIPETFNLLKGNNLGSAADSGILSDGTTTTFPMNVRINASLTVGNLWMGETTQPPGVPSIRTTAAGHIVINPSGSNPLLLNWESGGSGVTFGNGATMAVASVDNLGQVTAPSLIANGQIATFNNGTAFLDAYQGGGRLFAKSSGAALASMSLSGYSNDADGRSSPYLICSEPTRGVAQVAATVPVFSAANGHIRLLDRGASGVTSTGSPNIGADATKMVFNGGPSGGLYFNWDQGSSGIYFGNGAGGQVGRIDGAGSMTLSGSLGVAGLTIHSPGGSSIIDCSEQFFYVNFTGPAGIMQLINGSLTCVGLSAAGLANVGSLQVAGAAPAGQVLTGNGSTYVPAPPARPSGIPTDATGSRAFSGSYQNNTGGAIFVAVTYTVGGGGAAVRAYVGGGSASTLVAGQDRINAGGNNNLGGGNYAFEITFIVPAGWWYMVTESPGNTGAPAIAAWIENQL